MEKSTSRVATIKVGSTDYKIRLASWRPEPYRVQYRLVWPQSQEVPGAEGKIASDPWEREWHINNWDGGEGEDLWDSETNAYNKSSNMAPRRTGVGLTLAAKRILTQHDNAIPADFAEGRRFGFAHGRMWATRDDTIHQWQPATNNWDETGLAAGAAGGSEYPTSLIEGPYVDAANDEYKVFVGYGGTNAIYKVETELGGAATYNTVCTMAGDLTSLTYPPVLRNWGGTYYCLHGDDLFSFTNSAAANTFVQVSDVTGNSQDYLKTTGFEVANRMSSSDKGPIWIQRLDNGQTFIWEYNVSTATTRIVGRLFTDFATPYSIFFTAGYYFVGFRYADSHSQSGDAYLHYVREGQRGNAGPFRAPTGVTAYKPVLIAGMIGSDLCVFYDGVMWAYNLDSGGIYPLGESQGTDHTKPTEAITFGQSAFLANMSNAYKVERFDRTAYACNVTATWESGRYDFGYLNTEKIFTSVKIITDPLPAGQTISLAVSTDGDDYVTIDGTFTEEGATSYTWRVSTTDDPITGGDFEIRLSILSTDCSVTPRIRSVTARASGMEHQRTFQLELDSATHVSASVGESPRSADKLAAFREIATYAGPVTFLNPYEKERWDAVEEISCQVLSFEMLHAEGDDSVIPTLVLRDMSRV